MQNTQVNVSQTQVSEKEVTIASVLSLPAPFHILASNYFMSNWVKRTYLFAIVAEKSATATLRNPLTLLEQCGHLFAAAGLNPKDILSFDDDYPLLA